jgi:hypothetical protein
MSVDSPPASIPVEGAGRHAYNEAAFHYFLEIERKRAARSRRPLLLMAVTVEKRLRNASDAARVSSAIFSVLDANIREVDFFGWYSEGIVAAAALTVDGPTSKPVLERLQARVLDALKRKLPPDEAAYAKVRVVEALNHR